MIIYETQWQQKDRNGKYRTKTYTNYHKKIHEVCDYALTIKIDSTIPFPFGIFTEVIQKTGKWKKQ